MSLFSYGIQNIYILFAIMMSIMLIIIGGYFLPFNIAFGMRDNIFRHFGITVIPFALLQLFYD